MQRFRSRIVHVHVYVHVHVFGGGVGCPTVSDPRLIDRPEALEAALAPLHDAPLLTVDTEFTWERTYGPILALVQVAGRLGDRVHAVAVDPLRVDLAPLVRLLAEPTRLKVVHAGRQDLEILLALHGAPITPVFDTQRAAALLGFGHQVGYAGLVERLLGLRIDKGEQWSGWTRRPLRPEQVEYALGDVIPLLDAYDRVIAELEQLGRLGWAEEEMGPLVRPEAYVIPADEERYRDVKNRNRLDRRGLGVLRELAAWRERTARARDMRPSWIIKDPALVELARRRPAAAAGLEGIAGLPQPEARRYAAELLACIERGMALPDEALPGIDRNPGPDTSAQMELLRAHLGKRAEALAIAPATLATMADLERLARAHLEGAPLDDGAPGLPFLLTGWRADAIGRELLSLLQKMCA